MHIMHWNDDVSFYHLAAIAIAYRYQAAMPGPKQSKTAESFSTEKKLTHFLAT